MPQRVYRDDEVMPLPAPKAVYTDDEVLPLDEAPAEKPAAPSGNVSPNPMERLGQAAWPAIKQTGIGALKSAGEGAFYLGKAIKDYTPFGRLVDAIQPLPLDAPPEGLERKGAWENLGGMAEQTAEMGLGGVKLLPSIARAVASSKLHGGSNAEAGASGAITATLPAAIKGVTRFAGALRASAERTMSRAITPGGGSRDIKREAAKVVPQMLDKGVRGSAEAMAQKASDAMGDIGPKIGKVYDEAATRGVTMPGQKVVDILQAEKAKFMVADAMGNMIPQRGAERLVKELDGFSDFVSKLDPNIPVKEAAKLKTNWQTLAAQGNQYVPGQPQGVAAAAKTYVAKKGAAAIKQTLDGITDLSDLKALNDEYAFWKGVSKVLQATQLRQVGHTGGLFTGIAGTAGGVFGFSRGENIESRAVNAITGIAVSRALVRAVTSPWWRTTLSAPLKDALAKAMASDSMKEALSIANRMSAAAVVHTKSATTARP